MTERCLGCPGINKPIPPDGPEHADILLVGEAPGKTEERVGRVFVGKTGEELDKCYLPLAALQRENVIITNSIRCLPPGPDGRLNPRVKKDRELLDSCSVHHLYNLIDRVKPKVIVPMGAFACLALDPNINLELHHGFPIQTAFGTTFPMYHPAGGIHNPKAMLLIRTDWDRLRKYIRGTLSIPSDEYAGAEDYQELTKASQVSSILRGEWDLPLANDTEVKKHSKQNPFCVTFSIRPGTGYLIRADNKSCLLEYQAHLNRWKGPILWHNWLFDSEVVPHMGLIYPHNLIRDTMVMTFHLGNLPQGLKPLAYRELGMEMQDFDDVVTPYSTPLCLTYLRQAMDVDWPKPEPIMERDEGGNWKIRKPQGMRTKIKRFFTDYVKSPEDVDVFERWDNWEHPTKGHPGTHAMIESGMEESWPGKCITYVPFEKALFYACRDADALLRLYPILLSMKARVRRFSQEHWRV